MKYAVVVVISLLTMSFFTSCHAPEREEQIKEIDSIANALESANKNYEMLDLDRIEHIMDSVNNNLNYIQSYYVGDMKKSIAFPLMEYRSIRKLIPGFGDKREEIANNLNVSREQLANLKKALQENATHDAVGNEINDAYIEKQLEQENEINKELVDEMNFVISRSDSIFNRYNRYRVRVNFWRDSIAAKSNGKPVKLAGGGEEEEEED